MRSSDTLHCVDGNSQLRLTLKLEGPLVDDHRLPLSELLRVGKQLKSSLRDVAIVLAAHGPSGFSGRAKKAIEAAVDLSVVASPKPGSFVLEMEAPVGDLIQDERLIEDIGPHLSERTIVAFLDGLGSLDDDIEQLPTGFDRGVLQAIVPFQTAMKNGLSGINLVAKQNGTTRVATITTETIDVARRLIRKPVKAETSVEGVLQMVDFGSLECRIDRPPMPSVTVYFDQSERDAVHKAVRQFVRVAGEGHFEPGFEHATKVWANEFVVRFETLSLDPNAFFAEKSIHEIAGEQATPKFSIPANLASDSWRDDDEAAALVEAIRSAE